MHTLGRSWVRCVFGQRRLKPGHRQRADVKWRPNNKRQALRANIASQHIPRLAQVSQSAVSQTYTPGASVSVSTPAWVMDAARQLGYRPKATARSLISRRSRISCVVMSQLDNQFHLLVIEKTRSAWAVTATTCYCSSPRLMSQTAYWPRFSLGRLPAYID